MPPLQLGGWRDRVLSALGPDDVRLRVVADPDGLLLDERILQVLRERQVELLTVEDPVAFRFEYELRFRSRWDRGETVGASLLVRVPAARVDHLPFDLLATGRTASLGLAQLFPKLSPAVVVELAPDERDRLDHIQASLGHQPLGENATIDFLLLHVFDVDVARVHAPRDLLEVLLRLHQNRRRVTRVVAERLVEHLRAGGTFSDWPLDRLISDRDEFIAFLQERWPIFLARLVADRSSALGEEPVLDSYLAQPGPALLPLGDAALRPYVSSFFLDGELRPTRLAAPAESIPVWARLGILQDPSADRRRRLRGLLGALETAVPGADASYRVWSDFARRWAELGSQRWASAEPLDPDLGARLAHLRDRVDAAFRSWLAARYGGLYNQPDIPVMVHHIPRALARYRNRHGNPRLALVVFDGLALDQWVTLRGSLSARRPAWHFDEGAVFAWVPTVTSVSRQAIFSGQRPDQFAASIGTTAREAVSWTRFWENEGVRPSAIGYAILPNEPDTALAATDALIDLPRREAVGVVVRVVDEIVHGTPLGSVLVHDGVRALAAADRLPSILDRLLDGGFHVFLTSDHGNIESAGIGRPSEGVLAETRGARARVYSTATLRAQAHAAFPEATIWPPLGLPADFLPLLAPDRGAFVTRDEVIVAHGGASLEEIIVPYIHLQVRTKGFEERNDFVVQSLSKPLRP